MERDREGLNHLSETQTIAASDPIIIIQSDKSSFSTLFSNDESMGLFGIP